MGGGAVVEHAAVDVRASLVGDGGEQQGDGEGHADGLEHAEVGRGVDAQENAARVLEAGRVDAEVAAGRLGQLQEGHVRHVAEARPEQRTERDEHALAVVDAEALGDGPQALDVDVRQVAAADARAQPRLHVGRPEPQRQHQRDDGARGAAHDGTEGVGQKQTVVLEPTDTADERHAVRTAAGEHKGVGGLGYHVAVVHT